MCCSRASAPHGKKITKQVWNILDKIREVDALLQSRSELLKVVREVHPEVCFRELVGRSMVYRKARVAGRDERRRALTRSFPQLDMIEKSGRDQGLPIEDILDAVVAAGRRDAWRTVMLAACLTTARQMPRGFRWSLGLSRTAASRWRSSTRRSTACVCGRPGSAPTETRAGRQRGAVVGANSKGIRRAWRSFQSVGNSQRRANQPRPLFTNSGHSFAPQRTPLWAKSDQVRRSKMRPIRSPRLRERENSPAR